MGSSLSKVFKRNDCEDEVYQPCPPPPIVAAESVEFDEPEPEQLFPRTQTFVDNSANYAIHRSQAENYNEYYDDDEMIQFVTELSLAQHNQSSSKVDSNSELSFAQFGQSSSKADLNPKKPQVPDLFKEFFESLEAHSPPGPSTSIWGKSPAVGKISFAKKEDQPVETPPKQECAICVEEKPLKGFPHITKACEHPDRICLVCVQNWFAREVDSTAWDKIHCVACNEIVPYNDMKRLMTKAAFEKYDQYSRNSLLSTLPNFRWCIKPTCPSGQIHESGTEGPIFFCNECYSKTCVIHNVPWHEGETCNEYEYRKDPKVKEMEEKATEKEIKGSAKKCPGKGCRVNITRNGGCDHMRCTRCSYEFCWLCLADYNLIRKNGNSFHKKDCKLHSDNLV